MASFKIVSEVGTMTNGGLPSGTGVPPPDVTAITVSGFMNNVSGVITLTVAVTPAISIGTFAGCHLYLEIPDQSANPAAVIGVTPVGGTAAVTGAWSPLDIGFQPYVASQQPWTITFPMPPGIDPTVDVACRLYAVSFSSVIEKVLFQAGLSGASPNQTFSLVSLQSGTPNSGTNVTTLIGGNGTPIAIVATVLPPQNVTGKLETPVQVILTDTPPATAGWVAQLVLTIGSADPKNQANQQIVSGFIMQAGPVYTPAADGVAIPHSFILDTPSAFTSATVWLQAGLVDAQGNHQWNNIIPGITPSFPITYGSTTGTTDATAVMLSTISASMSVVNNLFGVAPNGITNPLLGPSAVATLNIQALAITNPLLASLAVQAANLASGSVTATAIAALAVGTGAIQTAAITNALIANAAISGAQIQSATITSVNVGLAAIAGANIGSATITAANIASATITTVQIASATIQGVNIATATITDANIATLNVSKLVAGTATFTGTVTLKQSGSGSQLVLTSNTVNLTINGTAGIALDASGNLTVTNSLGTSTAILGNAVNTGQVNAAAIRIVGPGTLDFPSTMTSFTATAGTATLPSNPIGFMIITYNNGVSTAKFPLYSV